MLHKRPHVVAAALLLAACSRAPEPPPPAIAASSDFVGSEACGECHADITDAWRDSHHALAMQHADAATVLGAFDGREASYFEEAVRFFERDGELLVRTLDASGEPAEFRVAYTFGVEPIQQYLVEFPGGRLQALPWLWDTRPAGEGGQRWLHLYPDEYVAPGDSLHWTGRRQNWNYMCAECHSTNVVVGYDTRSDTFDTRYDEISVGCEACHGPGSEHIDRARAAFPSGHSGLKVDLDDHAGAAWVMNAATGIAALDRPLMDPQVQPEACGRCHARRGVLDEPYEYGKPLAETHRVSNLGGGLYFPDGQILDEVYVYGSFVQSRMYQAGVSCTDCHDPHTAKLVTGPDPNAVCAQCHSPAVFGAESHMGHTPEVAGCVDCHMPARTYMVVDDRRDHSFRIPRADIAAETGSPLSCMNCHADATLAWAEAAIGNYASGEPRASFAGALSRAAVGHANPALVDVVTDRAFPGIARAAAIEALAPPFSERDLGALVNALADPDPLVRIGALASLRGFAPQEKARFAGTLLADPVKSVRIDAALAFADSLDYLDAGDRRAFDAAAAEFRRSRLLTASQADSLLSLAAFEARTGNRDAARPAFERALFVEPGWSVARTNFADFLREEGDDEGGEKILREGLERAPDDATLHHALGLLLVRTGREVEALESLRLAAELDAGNPRFSYVLGVALNSMGRPDDAATTLARAFEQHPGSFDVAWALATISRDRGDIERAKDVLATMRERFPANPDVEALARELAGSR